MVERRERKWRTGWILAAAGLGGLVAAGGYGLSRISPLRALVHPCTPGAVSPERLKAHVRALSETFVPRDHLHPENLERTADYLVEALTRAGGRVRSEPYTVDGRPYRNVIAAFGPEQEERLVIGAHYDAAEGTPGANDNASGVAGLLELASLLGARPPTMRVELVGFTLEEPPHFGEFTQGSRIHARGLSARKVKVRAMLSLESLGYFSDAPDSQSYPTQALRKVYPSQGHFIAVVGRSLREEDLIATVHGALRAQRGLASESLASLLGLEGMGFSDHASFWDAGYHAVMVTDTALFRDPAYHRAQDTWERLDYERMARVVQGIHCAVEALAPLR